MILYHTKRQCFVFMYVVTKVVIHGTLGLSSYFLLLFYLKVQNAIYNQIATIKWLYRPLKVRCFTSCCRLSSESVRKVIPIFVISSNFVLIWWITQARKGLAIFLNLNSKKLLIHNKIYRKLHYYFKHFNWTT